MKSFLEIIGAMGLSNPSDLSPNYVMRRVNDEEVKSLGELYIYVKPGQFLVDDDFHYHYKKYWDLASADKF